MHDEAQQAVTTVSHPERPVYRLIYGLLGFTALLLVVTTLAATDEPSAGGLVLGLGLVALTTLLCVGLIKVLVVHTRATVQDGLTLALGHFVSRRLPWEAISSIEKAPTGGATDVGWKWLGPGRIGYLAGAENILITIRPEFREKVITGETSVEGRQKIAEWYYVSVPDPELTAQRLDTLRARALDGDH